MFSVLLYVGMESCMPAWPQSVSRETGTVCAKDRLTEKRKAVNNKTLVAVLQIFIGLQDTNFYMQVF